MKRCLKPLQGEEYADSNRNKYHYRLIEISASSQLLSVGFRLSASVS